MVLAPCDTELIVTAWSFNCYWVYSKIIFWFFKLQIAFLRSRSSTSSKLRWSSTPWWATGATRSTSGFAQITATTSRPWKTFSCQTGTTIQGTFFVEPIYRKDPVKPVSELSSIVFLEYIIRKFTKQFTSLVYFYNFYLSFLKLLLKGLLVCLCLKGSMYPKF